MKYHKSSNYILLKKETMRSEDRIDMDTFSFRTTDMDTCFLLFKQTNIIG